MKALGSDIRAARVNDRPLEREAAWLTSLAEMGHPRCSLLRSGRAALAANELRRRGCIREVLLPQCLGRFTV